jgi:hypothetical protein
VRRSTTLRRRRGSVRGARARRWKVVDLESGAVAQAGEWTVVTPAVEAVSEFSEIVNDFGDPLELLREAISNAIDARATELDIKFTVEEIEGARRLVIKLTDNGEGMSRDVLSRDFWGLGYSPSRSHSDKIGEKGHGTEIFLRSERVEVKTQHATGSFESLCDRPLGALSQQRLHEPRVRSIQPFRETHGTEIRVVGYNDNERSKFVQNVVRDYLLWFTKVGSVEREFGPSPNDNFVVRLQCLDRSEPEEVRFGHVFPAENSDIERLFDQHGTQAADLYVKKFVWKEQRLRNHPEVTFDAVIYVEGDEAKRHYNPMIRERRRADTGRYRVGDRYGIYLCKDYIPIMRVNEWVVGFGAGSNAFVLLHGFVNCQSLKLTANRGSVANTDPEIFEELREAVAACVETVNQECHRQALYTLKEWQEEHRTLEQERSEFQRRVRGLRNKKVARLEGRLLVEPQNESELFGLFMSVYALRPDVFAFEPLDYNTTRGVDVIARNRSESNVIDGEHAYVELKYVLRTEFNHAFAHLRWIVCWDFDRGIAPGAEFRGVEENDVRVLVRGEDNDGKTIYFLDNRLRPTKIQVIRLSEYLKERLNLEFGPQG